MNLTKSLKKILKRLGYDVVRLKGGLGYGTTENELLKILKSIQVDLILDIGANRGLFAKALFDYGYENKVLSFEPISKMHQLLTKASDKNPNWIVYDRSSIGEKEGRTTINISNLIGNSSIMPIKSTKYNVKQSQYVAKEEVDQITLGTLNSNDLVTTAKNIFVKMDVQGYEHMILNGLDQVNYFITGFYIELSLVELYEGQKDYLYICNQLRKMDYDLVYIVPESIRSERMIQFNGVFLHKSLSYTT